MEFQQLVLENRDRLKRLANLRLGRDLQGRVDSSDVVQEACIDALRQFEKYRESPDVSPYQWLRFFVCQKIIQLHRTHVKTQARDARRDVSIHQRAGPEAESSVLALNLFGKETTPSKIAQQQERTTLLVNALDALEPIDREVIALRNFEQLSTEETANILGLSVEAVYKRHSRALIRLKKVFNSRDPDA